MTVLVVGAGIAGLGLAIALARDGVSCEVVEIDGRAEGASIGLTNRAVDVLAELGVLDECVSAGDALSGSVFERMYDAAGRPLPVPPIPARVDGDLPGAVVIDRPSLSRILLSRAREHGAIVRNGLTVSALEQRDDRVDVRFSDGSAGSYRLVVGADGIRSRVRELVYGDSVRPDYTGLMSLRCVLPDPPEGAAGFYHGPDATTVIVARKPGGPAYVTTGRRLPGERLGQARARELLRENLGRFTAPYLAAIRDRVTEDVPVIVRPFEWLLVPPPWHRGRVVVIGDAAHATTAHLSSGGGMALEDGAVLAQELTRHPDVAEALDAFGRRRGDRVRMVVETSVELLRMEQRGVRPRDTGRVRAAAMSVLAQPY